MAGLSDIINFFSSKVTPQETEVVEEEAIITPDSVVEEIAVEDYTPSITDTVFSRAQGRPDFANIDMQGEDSLANLNWMADTIGKIESDNNPDAEYQGPESSAKGEYQWLTNPKEGQPAFITGINRAINNYVDSGHEPPAWLYEAKKHGDPIRLDKDQQREIFFADIFERKGSDTLIKKIIENKDIDALKELYLNKWHTNPDKATIDRVNRILSKATGGMVMRDPYYNYNKQRAI
jgi:hypothetical protein